MTGAFRRWARRYAGHAAVIAVVAALVTFAPSRSPRDTNPFAIGVGADRSLTSTPTTAPEGTDPSATGGPAAAPSGTADPTGTATGSPAPGGPGSPSGSVPSSGEIVGEDCARVELLGAAYGCRPVWQGSNGGATYAGVGPEIVNVVIYKSATNAQIDAVVQQAGLSVPAAEIDRITRQYAEWAQTAFETYGREVQVHIFQSTALDVAAHRAEAVRVASELDPFLVTGALDTNFIDEIARRGIVCICGAQLPGRFHLDRAPFVYETLPDGDTTNALIAGWMTRRLGVGSPAAFGGPDVNGKPRVLGIVHPNDSVFVDNARDLKRRLTGAGFVVSVDAGYASDISTATQQATNLVQQLVNGNVTTMVCVCDPVAPYFFYAAATAQRYFPEHIQTGYAYQDLDEITRLYDTRQAVHSFGVSMLPIRRPSAQSAFYKLYRERNGGALPPVAAEAVFAGVLPVFRAIEVAGPTPHPGTLRDGLFSHPRPYLDRYSPSVSYSATDFGGIDDAREVWWDPDAPSSTGHAGTYRSVNDGRRYTPGDWPANPTPVFRPECTAPSSCGER